MEHYVSKTDYKIGSSCPKKLWYKKHGYPTLNDQNEYMQYLAKRGYILSQMAQLLYPGGIDLSGITDWDDAVQQTNKLLKTNEDIVLYEATVYSAGKLARIDILEKKGSVLNIIEVKAKSQDSEDQEKKIPKEYLHDVLFQVITAEEAFPDYQVNGYLFLPDKSKLNQIEGLAGWFTIDEGRLTVPAELDELPARPGKSLSVPTVKFLHEDHPEK